MRRAAPATRPPTERGVARLLCLAVLVLSLLGATACGEPKRDGQVVLSVEPGPAQAAGLVRRDGAVRRAVATFNRELDLPTDIRLTLVGDRTAGEKRVTSPTYDPVGRTIYFPWSFALKARREIAALPARDRPAGASIDRLTAGAMQFVLFHELGHGVIDVLGVPVVGGEEPTVDSLASVFSIASGTGPDVPLGGAALTAAEGGRARRPSEDEYASEHDVSRERAYDALCLLYGSDPRRWAELRESLRSRAQSCEYGYQQDLRGWRKLLADALTDEGGLLPLRQ